MRTSKNFARLAAEMKKPRPKGAVLDPDERRRALDRVDPRGEPGNLAGRFVAVDQTLVDAAHDLGLGVAQCRLRGILVGAGDRQLDILDESADTADAGAVDLVAPRRLPNTFLRLLVIGHVVLNPGGRLRLGRIIRGRGYSTREVIRQSSSKAC